MHRFLISAALACASLPAHAQAPTIPSSDASTAVPSGVGVRVELLDAVDSSRASAGQRIRGRLAHALKADGAIALPAGTPVEITVLAATPAARWGASGTLSLQADIVTAQGRRLALRDLSIDGTAPARERSAMGQILAPQRGGLDVVLPAGTVATAALAHSLPAHTATSAVDAGAGDRDCCLARAGHRVELELVETVGSATHATGQEVFFKLIDAIVVDGVMLAPAGSRVTGQVVHAARSRGGGAAGELLLAARTLDLAGRATPLRGLKLGATGQDKSVKAAGLAIAVGAFAMLVKGGEVEIPAGTRATAKLAQDLTQSPAASPPDAPTTEPTRQE